MQTCNNTPHQVRPSTRGQQPMERREYDRFGVPTKLFTVPDRTTSLTHLSTSVGNIVHIPYCSLVESWQSMKRNECDCISNLLQVTRVDVPRIA